MQNTEMCFYDNLYAKELSAKFVDFGHDEKARPYVVLDRTIFHSHGGGQKGDGGKLILRSPSDPADSIEFRVIDTRGEKGGVIKHLLDRDPDDVCVARLAGRDAILQLDWAFRYTQMRLHSGNHLIHSFMERFIGHALPYPRISDILEDYCLNVYESILDVKIEDMPRIVERLNEFLAAGHRITTYPDTANPVHRYWECDGIVIPCGGTHPCNTTEIGRISASMSVKKGSTKVLLRLEQAAPSK